MTREERVYHGQYSLDGVYWSDGKEWFSVFMEIWNGRQQEKLGNRLLKYEGGANWSKREGIQ